VPSDASASTVMYLLVLYCLMLTVVEMVGIFAIVFSGGDGPLFVESTGNRYKNTSPFLVKRPLAAFLFCSVWCMEHMGKQG
jgi:hypothetical protein